MDFELSPEQQRIQQQASIFAEQEVAPLAREADEKGEFPLHLVKRMGELGFLAGPIEPEYGGSGMDYVSYALLCAFLIETDTPGFHREPMPGKGLGHRASEHVHITLKDCMVHKSALLGTPGEGFKVAMSALDRGRLGVAAGALGIAQACLDACIAFATQRRQFGQRIADFQMI